MLRQVLCNVSQLNTSVVRGHSLHVYSETILPIFIEIGSYLTDTEQKISWHSFFLRHGVCDMITDANTSVVSDTANCERCYAVARLFCSR